MIIDNIIYQKLQHFTNSDRIYLQGIIDNYSISSLKREDQLSFLRFLNSIDENSSDKRLSVFINFVENLYINNINSLSDSTSYKNDITLTTSYNKVYNIIYVTKGDDVFINIDVSGYGEDLVGQSYTITIYDEEDNTELINKDLTTNSVELVIDDFDFTTEIAHIVVEDRADPQNIEKIVTIGFIYFIKYE